MSEEKYSDRIKSLVEETVDKLAELINSFNEQAGDIVKDATKSEKIEKIVDGIADVRREIADGTADIIKTATNAIVDTGESIISIIKREDELTED